MSSSVDFTGAFLCHVADQNRQIPVDFYVAVIRARLVVERRRPRQDKSLTLSFSYNQLFHFSAERSGPFGLQKITHTRARVSLWE